MQILAKEFIEMKIESPIPDRSVTDSLTLSKLRSIVCTNWIKSNQRSSAPAARLACIHFRTILHVYLFTAHQRKRSLHPIQVKNQLKFIRFIGNEINRESRFNGWDMILYVMYICRCGSGGGLYFWYDFTSTLILQFFKQMKSSVCILYKRTLGWTRGVGVLIQRQFGAR